MRASRLSDSDALAAVTQRLRAPPLHRLGEWPTPLQRYDHSTLGPILVKRDDLAKFGGEARSGVKARKLEGLLEHMVGRKLDTICMPIGNLTNLGPDLVRVARGLGITVRLLIVDDPPLPPDLRQATHALYAGSATLCGPNHAAAALKLGMTAVGYRLRGKRALSVPPSPAHPSAVLGTVRGYLEAMDQSLAQFHQLPRVIYLASAAGSSIAGFAIGEALMRGAGHPSVRIVAVQVGPEPLRLWLPLLIAWTRRAARLGDLPRCQVSVIARGRHAVYGRFDSGHIRLCERVEEVFGLKIDPIYGGKSWDVMESEEAGVNEDRPPLFWHCGYTPAWRDFAAELSL
ncbi:MULTISPECIES: hypothetical protein [unclassified Mesorhizobium]|uniref:hypothetical protein n=1 Tax=unclassified Mesorhizobium TaxID=325217 RepID=UPI003339976B